MAKTIRTTLTTTSLGSTSEKLKSTPAQIRNKTGTAKIKYILINRQVVQTGFFVCWTTLSNSTLVCGSILLVYRKLSKILTLQQLKYNLLTCISLGKNRCSSLLKYLTSSQLSTCFSIISILNLTS